MKLVTLHRVLVAALMATPTMSLQAANTKLVVVDKAKQSTVESKSPQKSSPASKVKGLLEEFVKVSNPTQKQIDTLKKQITVGEAIQFFRWFEITSFNVVRKRLMGYDYSILNNTKYNSNERRLLAIKFAGDVFKDCSSSDLRILNDVFCKYVLEWTLWGQLEQLLLAYWSALFLEPLIALDCTIDTYAVVGLFDKFDDEFINDGIELIQTQPSSRTTIFNILKKKSRPELKNPYPLPDLADEEKTVS